MVPVRFGIEVSNLFNSTRVTRLSQGIGVVDPVSKGTVYPYDQYFFQVGRAFTGDVTVAF